MLDAGPCSAILSGGVPASNRTQRLDCRGRTWCHFGLGVETCGVHGMPAGTVTMLVSDIEGSTRLLSRMGGRYAEALDQHRTLLRVAWRQWSGRELGTEGDSFFVVFEGAGQAVGAALEAQQSLAAQTWPGDQRL